MLARKVLLLVTGLANITLPNVEEMALDREARLLATCNIDQFHTRSQRATARSTVSRAGFRIGGGQGMIGEPKSSSGIPP